MHSIVIILAIVVINIVIIIIINIITIKRQAYIISRPLNLRIDDPDVQSAICAVLVHGETQQTHSIG